MKLIMVFLTMALVALWIRLNTTIDVMHDMDAKIKLLASAASELNTRCPRR
jgi:hypothetical protein